ncbi:MAG: mevalonate kinase [Candidatus Hermodarchaeota archaeon]
MIRIKAPGRICLFGEHQDYLNFPVIAMAISKYIYLEAERISDAKFQIELPNIDDTIEIPLNNKELEYESKRDYIRSGYNIVLRKGIEFKKGYKIKLTGDIPMGAGVSSSSALVVAWLSFLNQISDLTLNNYQLATEGYNAEVKEFGEAGGKMDFFTSVYGKLIILDLQNKEDILRIDTKLDGFVLGNSLEKKNTVVDLMRVKSTALNAFKVLKKLYPNFNQYKTSLNELFPYLPNLKKEFQKIIEGNIRNRDITLQAKELILQNLSLLKNPNKNVEELNLFYCKLGGLLNNHQTQLDKNIGISTKKINTIIKSCHEAGSFGAKINGSGFGGTMFALLPGREEKIKKAIESVGGEASTIKTSNGVEVY